MQLTTWNPLAELDNLLSRRNMLGALVNGETDVDWKPAADISETDNEYLIKADLPEVKPEDVDLTIANGVITLSGERHLEKRQDDEKTHRIERFHGRFVRSFSLPDDVDTNDISATQKGGVLTVHLPKAPEAKPRSIKVGVK